MKSFRSLRVMVYLFLTILVRLQNLLWLSILYGDQSLLSLIIDIEGMQVLWMNSQGSLGYIFLKIKVMLVVHLAFQGSSKIAS